MPAARALRTCCLALLLFSLLTLLTAERAHAAKHALLIGINSYDGTSFAPLSGCRNDVQLMRQVLLSHFGFDAQNIATLQDNEATHERILAEMERLRRAVTANDVIYIHYSGHGSTACDLNGDEGQKRIDSSLVTYGSRSGPEVTSKGACPTPETLAALKEQARAARGHGSPQDALDDFDLLDDEMERSLSALSAVTQNIIFVSDSCHSGTITRGAGAASTRGAAIDLRPHPAGFLEPLPPGSPRAWLGIGAAKDTEKAVEYHSDDGKPHGAFTLFWAKALLTSHPDESWLTVFNRTKALMRDAQLTQNPQLEGKADKKIFSHQQGNTALTFTVTYANSDGDKAEVSAGSLLGIAKGSRFSARCANGKDATLTVTEVDTLSCTVAVQGGKVSIGSGAVLTDWMPPEFRLKAFVRVPDKAAPEAAALRGMVAGLPAVQVVEKEGGAAGADMVFWLVRPRKDAQGKELLAEGSLLPLEDPKAAPEVWVLNASETALFAGQSKLKASATPQGLADLAANLNKLVRMRAVLNMPAPGSGTTPVQLSYLLFAPVTPAQWNALPADRRIELADGSRRGFTRTLAASGQEFALQDHEDLVMVQARNTTQKHYYVYALNITEDAAITPFVPNAEHPVATEVAPGETRVFNESVLLLTEPTEYVRLMVTSDRLDIIALQQQGYAATRAGQGSPVERMLGARLAPTRGAAASTTMAPAAWGTVKSTFVRP